jgi:hypothetical protein
MLTVASAPMKRTSTAMMSVKETGYALSAWISLRAISWRSVAQPEHEAHLMDDSKRENRDSERTSVVSKLRAAFAFFSAPVCRSFSKN